MKEGGMGRKGVRFFLQKEYQVIFELSNKYSINSLCISMNINRSGFYKWLKRRNYPSITEINRNYACKLFEEYHNMFPSHGYRWLNAKIKLDLGIVVSDMTAFWANEHYYELTLFMDLFNNELIGYSLSNKKGDSNTYHNALSDVIFKKNKEYKDLEMILHSDQGSVYSSKKFNESLSLYNIIHSMSKPGSPTENGSMEAINGWIKEELFLDFKINSCDNIFKQIEDYIYYFNSETSQFALKYLTPIQFKNYYYNKSD